MKRKMNNLKELEQYILKLVNDYQLSTSEYRILMGMLRLQDITKEKLYEKVLYFDS